MKRVASSIILCLILTTGFSQIKVWEDNRVSIATLGRSYGVQILPNAVVGFHPQVYADWAWMNLTYAPVKNRNVGLYPVPLIRADIHFS